MDHDGARRRVCDHTWQHRRLVVVVVVRRGVRGCHREGRLALCRCADDGRLGHSRSDQSPGPQRGYARQQKLAHSILLFAPADPAKYPAPPRSALMRKLDPRPTESGQPNLAGSMRRALLVSQQLSALPHGISETLCPSGTVRHARALIAPIAVHAVIGRRRTLMPSIPPSAATATLADRAMRVQRAAPRVAAPGWLAVAKTGERKTMEAPARRARRRSTGPCAELVIRPWRMPEQARPAPRAKMHPGPQCRRQPDIAGHHQGETARPADPRKLTPQRLAPRFAIMAQNHAGKPTRQPRRRRARIGEPARVGEQPKQGTPRSTPPGGSGPCPGCKSYVHSRGTAVVSSRPDPTQPSTRRPGCEIDGRIKPGHDGELES